MQGYIKVFKRGSMTIVEVYDDSHKMVASGKYADEGKAMADAEKWSKAKGWGIAKQ